MITDKTLSDFRYWLYSSQNIRYNKFLDLKELIQNEFILQWISTTDEYYINVVLVTNLQAFDYQTAKQKTIELFNYHYNKK